MPLGTHASRFSYPVFLDLDDMDVLVVGGGRIGARKAAGLAAAGARVRLVATEISQHVRDLPAAEACAEVIEADFADHHLDGVRLVITATGDHDVDQRISLAARSQGIWTNAADQPVDCEFILPAIARSGRVTAAISSDGTSPALAKWVRDQVAVLLDERIAEAAEVLAGERRAIQQGGGSTEDVDWRPRLHELGLCERALTSWSPEPRNPDRSLHRSRDE